MVRRVHYVGPVSRLHRGGHHGETNHVLCTKAIQAANQVGAARAEGHRDQIPLSSAEIGLDMNAISQQQREFPSHRTASAGGTTAGREICGKVQDAEDFSKRAFGGRLGCVWKPRRFVPAAQACKRAMALNNAQRTTSAGPRSEGSSGVIRRS
jgi:hypothetical protein